MNPVVPDIPPHLEMAYTRSLSSNPHHPNAEYAPCMQHAWLDLFGTRQNPRADYRGCIQHESVNVTRR